jgi:hypothetical protein
MVIMEIILMSLLEEEVPLAIVIVLRFLEEIVVQTAVQILLDALIVEKIVQDHVLIMEVVELHPQIQIILFQ